MTLLQAVLIAIIQGATEFLPVSSSGHTALAAKLLGLQQAPLDFVVTIHAGTLLSVLVYYRSDLLSMLQSLLPVRDADEETLATRRDYRKLLGLLLLATIPAAIAGFLLEDYVDAAFGDVRLIGGALLVTATVLALAARLNGRVELPETGWRQALTVGVAQALALAPGVSRSGMTIVGGLLSGMSRDWAPRFAFLLSVPVILGGAVLEGKNMLEGDVSAAFDPLNYGLSALVAGVVGYLSILLVTNSVKRGSLLYFSAYCAVVGIAAIISGFLW